VNFANRESCVLHLESSHAGGLSGCDRGSRLRPAWMHFCLAGPAMRGQSRWMSRYLGRHQDGIGSRWAPFAREHQIWMVYLYFEPFGGRCCLWSDFLSTSPTVAVPGTRCVCHVQVRSARIAQDFSSLCRDSSIHRGLPATSTWFLPCWGCRCSDWALESSEAIIHVIETRSRLVGHICQRATVNHSVRY